MRKSASLLAAALAAAIAIPALAADDNPPAKATPPINPDSTTDGSISVGGQRIAYQAVAGTITVGATEDADAQLGPDGNPLPNTDAAAAAAADKDGKDRPPVARMFYVAYFKKDVTKYEDRP